MSACDFEDYLENVDSARYQKRPRTSTTNRFIGAPSSSTLAVKKVYNPDYEKYNGKFIPTKWSEQELDNLWLGVRRHGPDNWFVILNDKNLRFQPNKTVDDLALRWGNEEFQLFHGHEHLQALLKPRPFSFEPERKPTRYTYNHSSTASSLVPRTAQSSESLKPLLKPGIGHLFAGTERKPKKDLVQGNLVQSAKPPPVYPGMKFQIQDNEFPATLGAT